MTNPKVMIVDYQTKDSGERQQYTTGMVRDTNEGKERFDLLFAEGVDYNGQFLTRLAQLLARGAEKYDARNWEKASTKEELDRFRESAFRHFVQWFTGEQDEDHGSAVVFNIMGAEHVRRKLEGI